MLQQQDFDNFKHRLKEWKETHPNEYNLSEEEMNGKDASGYQKILSLCLAISLGLHTRLGYRYFFSS